MTVFQGALPPFFIPGIGPTLFRQGVLGTAVALFAISSFLFMRLFFKSKSDSLYWYSLALALIAIGSCGVFLQKGVGSPIEWAGRLAQYVGTIYFLTAVLTAMREAPTKVIPLEKKYQDLLEHTNVVIYTLDKDGVITYVSPAIKSLIEYTPSEVTGRHFTEFVYQDDLQRSTDSFRRILFGYTEKNEYRVWTKSGEIHWVSTSSRPLFSGSSVVGAQGVLMDITESRKREETLVQERDLLRSLIDNIPDLVHFTDDKNRFIKVNKATAEFAGTTPENMIGKTEFDFFPREQAEAASAHDKWITKFNRPLVDKIEKITHVGGTEHWVSVTKIPQHNEKGQVIGTMGISRDFTEHKKAEEEMKDSIERLKTSFEFAPDGIYLTDLEGTFVDVNKATEQLLGYKREELIGKNFLKLQLLPSDQVRKVTDNLAKSAQGKPTGPHEITLRRKDSTQVAVEINTHPVKIKGKSSVLVIARDISERRSTEDARIGSERLKALREMARGLSHNFNNLLAIILGNAQLLEMGVESYKSEEIKERLGIIVRTTHEAGETVRRMQLFTRTELSTRGFTKIDLNEIVRSAIASTSSRWRDEAGARGTRIKIKGHLGDLPLLLGGRSELMEVLTNLIFNALEAMPEGGEITIRTEAKESEILLYFTDTGEGIPNSIKDKIFDPFFTTKGPKASGLGLSVSYGIIKRHQGKINVESTKGKGTMVTISIPVRRKSPLNEKEARNPGNVSSQTILVIDDEEGVREVLGKICQEEGYRVVLAETARQGLAEFNQSHFDLVLTDLAMPEMSGWDLAKTLKAIDPSVFVGLITGRSVVITKENTKKRGVDFIVSKPFDYTNVLREVNALLKSKKT
jgi:PAS domain S-box-containing protein